MDTNMGMRFEWGLELAKRPRGEARNEFIRDNLAELRQHLQVAPHYPGSPKNYRRSQGIKFADD
jgi:hypothetical protein